MENNGIDQVKLRRSSKDKKQWLWPLNGLKFVSFFPMRTCWTNVEIVFADEYTCIVGVNVFLVVSVNTTWYTARDIIELLLGQVLPGPCYKTFIFHFPFKVALLSGPICDLRRYSERIIRIEMNRDFSRISNYFLVSSVKQQPRVTF